MSLAPVARPIDSSKLSNSSCVSTDIPLPVLPVACQSREIFSSVIGETYFVFSQPSSYGHTNVSISRTWLILHSSSCRTNSLSYQATIHICAQLSLKFAASRMCHWPYALVPSRDNVMIWFVTQ